METTLTAEIEKAEVRRLLTSGIFNRAPNLALVLRYICDRYFEGEGGQIKEYSIAVEALGRPADFDQRNDSIVRVEMHRLRKRLREYYEGEGAERPVQIDIPAGQYAPRFIHRGAPAAPPVPSAPVLEAPAPPAAPAAASWNKKLWIGIAAVVLLAVAVPLRYSISAHGRGVAPPAMAGGPAGETVRILCGLADGEYVDHFGNTWSSDSYFTGGITANAVNHPIRGAADPRLYTTRREGAFRYDIPLKSGVYELRLHFAETMYGENNAAGGGESSRVFNVHLNGKEILSYLDVVGDAGSNTADIKVFKDVTPAADGKLHLMFEPISNQPILSGIEITPGVPGRMKAIRMVAQNHPYTDHHGQIWEPDRYASGGMLAQRNGIVSGTTDPDLYRGERFGNLSYVVPVTEGRYTVNLYFAETWFGPGKDGGGPGTGSRVFDILCNGVAVRRDFDIFSVAGGADRALTVRIPNVTPNHQGKVVVSLVPAANYALINAIEVVPETE